MYKKYLVVASKKDKAGMNIASQLTQFQNLDKFDVYFFEEEIIYTENLNLEKINKYDFIIFASRHKSAKNEKSLTIHPVGNFKTADFGGEVGKLGKSSALFQKKLFENLNSNIKKFDLRGYELTMEATHHGPLIDKPCLFIEIGSTEMEYNDKRAAFVIAKTISDTIENFQENELHEPVVAIGGPHYCPNFNKIQLKSNIAISHIIPSYAFPLTEEIIKEAVEKTEEEIEFVLLDWKGIGNAEEREKLIKILDKLYLRYETTTEINKRS